MALVLSLLLTMTMSLAIASMVMAQTETLSTTNYRLMSQARYGAESGVQITVNHLLNTYTPPPGVSNGDPITAYNTTVSPVTYNGNPVILSANASVASNYPVAGVQTAFLNALLGSLPSGTTTVNFAPYARLLAMQQVPTYGGTTATLQTWEIVSTGTITLGKPATVEVTANSRAAKDSRAGVCRIRHGGQLWHDYHVGQLIDRQLRLEHLFRNG